MHFKRIFHADLNTAAVAHPQLVHIDVVERGSKSVSLCLE
jgi:hypothetical protein